MKEAIRLLQSFWKNDAEKFSAKDALSMCSFYKETTRRNASLFNKCIRNNIVLFDQFVSWYTRVATVLCYSGTGEQIKSRAAYASLCSAIVSLMISIRHQVTLGHDLAAKILLRSLCEYVETLSLLLVEPGLVAEFQKEEFSDANLFWHRNVKSLKARKAVIRAAVGDSLDEKFLTEWLEWLREEDTILSLAAHPSFVAASMTRFLINSDDNPDGPLEWPPFLGYVSDFSVRTLRYAILTASTPVIIADFPFGKRGKLTGQMKFDERESMHVAIEKERIVLLSVIRFVIEEASENPAFTASLGR
ncbi:hypothetical protein M2323_004514 [Rhodoblastus acidophilus]|uniref:hypothetical protein n=1 Tax=Rhodoblastus acidophilus TaxID=1074 RepID=UPI0022245254|nr:hypothetical protein [Rhodoblastus acidophilus]MCW2286728.1 hypothetical protein [Rhodoblastus acidophilus]MCW2335565.1 hypothetical protein [Rhodoblastus acidophilus]